MNDQARVWIIQRCINVFGDEYEGWPGYCEHLMTRAEMKAALAERAERWPEYGFRGHNAGDPPPRRPQLRVVK